MCASLRWALAAADVKLFCVRISFEVCYSKLWVTTYGNIRGRVMRTSEGGPCPVCKWSLKQTLPQSDGHTRFNCYRCGKFNFSRSVVDDLPVGLKTDRQRAALSYSIRQAQRDGGPPPNFGENIEPILRMEFLPSAHEQADNLIR